MSCQITNISPKKIKQSAFRLTTFIVILLSIQSISAQTKYVTPTGAGLKNGTSWANAYDGTKLGNALDEAVSGSQFWIAAGTYRTSTIPNVSRLVSLNIKSGVSVYGGFAGTETNLNDRNFRTNITIFSGDINVVNETNDNSYHVVVFDQVTETALLDGVTIKSGNANNDESPDTKRGGGIYIIGGQNNVQIQNCTITNNNAGHGGGIYISGTGAPLIKSCIITNNNAALGGGACTIADNSANISPTFLQVFFTNNTCEGGVGSVAGAFSQTVSGSTNVNYINCVFANNSTSYGNAGGVEAVSFVGSCAVNVTNCTFVNNGSSENSAGNAIKFIVYVSGSITNSIFWNNYGGDIQPGSGSVTIANNIIQNGSWGGTGNSNANPLFLNSANIAGVDGILGTADDGLNFACNSPAKNTGSSTGAPVTDITGSPRPQGSGIDKGAYELIPKLPSVSITASENNICSSTSITFTATPANVGANPIYQWKKNGQNIGTNSNTFTANAWTDQDVISCQLTTNDETCVASTTINSNNIIISFTDSGIIYVKADATGANNGRSWADAFVSLQTAFEQTGSCITQIWVAKGVYKPSKNTDNNSSGPTDRTNTFKLPNVSVYGGFFGNETSFSQRDPFRNLTILSGDIDNNDINTDGNFINETSDDSQGDNAYNVVYKNGSPIITSLDGFVITGGKATINSGSADPNLRFNKGGGMYVINVGGNFSMANCLFIGNHSYTFAGALSLINATIKMDNCIFLKNHAAIGGAIYASSAVLTFNNAVFVENSALQGGGIFGDLGLSGTANHCTFYKNSANQDYGGGIHSISISTFNLKNSILWGNPGGSISTLSYWTRVLPTYCNIEGRNNGSTNISANPLFQSTTDWDGPDNIWGTADDGLMLQSNSPSKDTGTSSVLLNDIRGITRPYNTIPDMGAYEYSLTTLPNISIVASNSDLCVNTTVVFTATPANIDGLNPTYQWEKNENNVGTNSLTYEGTFTNGDIITCEMSIANPSQTIISNSITLTSIFADKIIYVDAAAPEGNNGSSWANAINNLQNAINIAVGCNYVTQIWVKAGTYFPSSYAYSAGLTLRDRAFGLKNNLAIYGGFAGTETTLSQRNIQNNPTILSGDIGVSGDNTDNCYHVIVTPNNDNTAIVDGFIIKDGNANGSETIEILGRSVYQYGGGGIFSVYSSAQFNNCIIQQNNANTHGGGAYLDYGSPIFNNTVFTDNHIITGGGGGVFAYSSSYLITNCIFENNSSDQNGGGLYQLFSNSIIRNSTFYNNTATNDGGGIYHDNSAAPIINCIVWGNKGGGTKGIKGIYNGPYVSYSNVQEGFSGTGNISEDPAFMEANNPKGQDNIWKTADDGLQLKCGSKSINSGSNTDAPDKDIINTLRPLFSTVDMGAYESINFTDKPTFSENTTVGSGQSLSLTVNGCSGGTIKWYASATATSAISTNNPLTINPTADITYYVSCTINTCESLRLAIAVTVTICPSNPTVPNYEANANVTVKSQNVINASNTIGSNANVNYQAANSITLGPGFSTSAGTVFKATIQACN